MNGLIWLTRVETEKRVGVPLSRVVMIEHAPQGDGDGVCFLLEQGRRVRVSESLTHVQRAIAAAKAGKGGPEASAPAR